MGKAKKDKFIYIPCLFGSTVAIKDRSRSAALASARQEATGRAETKASRERLFIGTATLTPTSLHIYNVPENGYNRTARFEANKVNLRNNKHKGELSDKSIKKIKSAIEWLLIRSKPKPIFNYHQCDKDGHPKKMFFRLNFITLTLPTKQIHSDAEITQRVLNNFLSICRNRHGLVDYIWKAEAQRNGNIHFHLTTNTFIHKNDISNAWKSSLNLLGYIDRFHKKHKHRNPPCSQVQKVKHVRRIAAYLSSYMAKNKFSPPIGELRQLPNGRTFQILYTDKAYKDEGAYAKVGKVIGTVLFTEDEEIKPCRAIESNLWGCSQSISKCKNLRFDMTSVQWPAIQKLTRSSMVKCVKGDYVDSYYGPMLKALVNISPGLREDIVAHANHELVSEACSDDKLLQYLE